MRKRRDIDAGLEMLTALAALVLAGAACTRRAPRDVTPAEVEPPRWHFERVEHGLGTSTLSGAWSRNDGVVFIVGAGGMIATNRPSEANPDGHFVRMASPTTENLTAIVGVADGARFGLPALDGELFAVGWHGTLLHFHPNPDGDSATDDGAWQLIAGPTGSSLTARLRIDPQCPDYDGDGVPDDGDGDGWSGGDAVCHAGQNQACDDNCRGSANGPSRPLIDTTADQCIGPGDGPSPNPTDWQRDADDDSVGEACDDNDHSPRPASVFAATLFAVAARHAGTTLTVVAVGEGGAVVSYQGGDGAGGGALTVSDARAWLTEDGLAFRYSNDCPSGTPVGAACAGSGRLPPACPAQCNPRRTTCSCPPNGGQCCDPAASTGAACVDGTCPAAPNACDATSGTCSALCPQCFRRLAHALRAVAFVGNDVIATGADATVVVGNLSDFSAPWNAPSCVPTPKPLDEAPVLTAAGASAAGVLIAGSGGALGRYPAGRCPFAPVGGAPVTFLSAVAVTSDSNGFAVGDRGVVLAVRGSVIELLPSETTENLFGLTVTNTSDGERLWAVGAGGLILEMGYY